MIQGKAIYAGSGEEVSYTIFDFYQADTAARLPKDVYKSSRFGVGSGYYFTVATHRGFYTPVSSGDVIIYHDKYTEVISAMTFRSVYEVVELVAKPEDNKPNFSYKFGEFSTYTPDYPVTEFGTVLTGPLVRRKYQDRDINALSKEVAHWRQLKGFQTPSKFKDHSSILIKLMLIVSELSEASEAVRANDEANFREEMADTIIRILDLTGTMGIDIAEEIRVKMIANEKRPQKHGKSI